MASLTVASAWPSRTSISSINIMSMSCIGMPPAAIWACMTAMVSSKDWSKIDMACCLANSSLFSLTSGSATISSSNPATIPASVTAGGPKFPSGKKPPPLIPVPVLVISLRGSPINSAGLKSSGETEGMPIGGAPPCCIRGIGTMPPPCMFTAFLNMGRLFQFIMLVLVLLIMTESSLLGHSHYRIEW